MRILYVEDNPVDAELARRGMARQAPETVFDVATSLAAARARLDGAEGYDVALIDLRLPDGSGLGLLAEIRARALPLAVVMLTGSGDHESAVAALKAGADDYLLKSGDYLARLRHIAEDANAHFRMASGKQSSVLRVLYAEHNQYDVDLIRRHLAQRAPHIRLEVVASAQEALDRLPGSADAASDYDVVLLDYRLPGLDALEAVKVLRKERGLKIPVVLVTGHGSEEVAAMALHLGVDDYLTKHAGYLYELPATLENAYRKVELVRERNRLAESEARIRLLLDSTAEAIYGMDMNGLCTFVNPACLSVLGYDEASELLGKPIHALIHHTLPDGSPYPQSDCPIYQSFRGNEHRHGSDEVFWRRDGTSFPVEYWSYPMIQDGRLVGAVNTFFDIGERRRAEEKLRQAAMVFNSTRDGIVVCDLGARIVATNQAFTEITGYTEAEVLGENPRLFQSGRHGRDFYQAMWATLLETGHWRGETWNRRKNGEPYTQLLTISTVRDEAGRPSHYIGVATDISQLKHSEEAIEHLAHYDPLTDLPNRLLVQSRLEHALDQAQRHGYQVAVLYLDLDRFQAVNDSLGHPAGDELLVAVSQRLKRRLRDEDTLGRMGGDEFLIVLVPVGDAQEAAVVARDLLAEIVQPFILSDGQEIFIRASVGISLYPTDGDKATELLRNADTALFRAKDNGRDQLCFYAAEMNAEALANLELEAALRRALGNGEFRLHYQAKVDIRSGRIRGAEALIRWQREGIGLVQPMQFIPLAEKTDLIVEIGAWVIDKACRQIRDWLDQGQQDIEVAVNISARQFHSGRLDVVVAEALARHGVKAGHLELEVTESMLMQRPETAKSMLDKLKALGVKLSLDDFGTGYSSLAYLMRFPFDVLKIDQSFVRDIVTDANSAVIAISIIALAHRMGLRVVAEGVETEAQLGYLSMQGCDEMQGYLFSRPVPAEEYVQLLISGHSLKVAVDAAENGTLLLLDDDPAILSALRRELRGEGYRILIANNAMEALELLARNKVEVIVSDQRMPDMNGTDFLRRVKDMYPDTVRLVLSGYAELDTIIRAVNEGAIYKFLIKPWESEHLREHLRDAFRYHKAVVLPRSSAG